MGARQGQQTAYIPERFEPIEHNISDVICYYEYENETGEYYIIQISGEAGVVSIDNEHSINHQIEIQGEPADLYVAFDEHYFSSIVWYSKSDKVTIYITGNGSVDEMVKIAEGIGR